jgi:hypothetical protein
VGLGQDGDSREANRTVALRLSGLAGRQGRAAVMVTSGVHRQQPETTGLMLMAKRGAITLASDTPRTGLHRGAVHPAQSDVNEYGGIDYADLPVPF